MAKYRVKNTDILHDGKRYAEGSEIELTEKDAQALGGVVEKIEEKDKGGKSK